MCSGGRGRSFAFCFLHVPPPCRCAVSSLLLRCSCSSARFYLSVPVCVSGNMVLLTWQRFPVVKPAGYRQFSCQTVDSTDRSALSLCWLISSPSPPSPQADAARSGCSRSGQVQRYRGNLKPAGFCGRRERNHCSEAHAKCPRGF